MPRLGTWTAVLFAALAAARPGGAAEMPAYKETPYFAKRIVAGKLPPIAQRIPAQPSVVDLSGAGLGLGRQGGEMRLLGGRKQDVRQMVVYGYARLVGYDRDYRFRPDILARLEVDEGRIFTLHLRPGHRWSDGHPFTTEDFRYFWEDVATSDDLVNENVPISMLLDGQRPRFEVLSTTAVRFTWAKPNPFFLPSLAAASPSFIYRPAHYLKNFHARHADTARLSAMVKSAKRRNWMELHYVKSRQYKNINPSLPSLQPWVLKTAPPAKRFTFERNPYYHRVDKAGWQLPYIDVVKMAITSGKLIILKTQTGESDLQSRGLNFNNYTVLKQAEKESGYQARLWQTAKGARWALFPNLNSSDPAWRKLFRDVRFRRALSMATDRHEINQVLFYGLALEANNTMLPKSALYKKEYAKRWTRFDPAKAGAILDELGLKKRNSRGIRLLPDGRPMRITVAFATEESEPADLLALIADSWRKVGIELFSKPLQRQVMRNRIFSGLVQMSMWFGLENGIAGPETSPEELAPTSQQQLQWPKWGQYFETGGKAGEPIALAPAKRLFALNDQWKREVGRSAKERIWHEMLALYTDQMFSIGLVAGVPQVVVVSRRLRNVPRKAIYNWDPGAHFGIYRPDTFWFDKPGKAE